MNDCRFESFDDNELRALFGLMRDRHGLFAYSTRLLAEVLLEMFRRGLVDERLAYAPHGGPAMGCRVEHA